MDFRVRRQLIVLLVVGLVTAGVIFLLIRANLPEPTCFDAKQNQGEEETDCGGPCLPCALRHQKEVEVLWTRFVKTRTNSYDVVAEMRNPNVKLAARSFQYEFKLFDTTGFMVVSRRGISYLYPGETVHLAEVGLLTQRDVVRASLVIDNFDWALTDDVAPDIIAGNREYLTEDEDGTKRSIVRALVNNRTIKDIPDVEIVALVFDENGNVLGVNKTLLSEVQASQTMPIKLAWPTLLSPSVSTITIEARSRAGLPSK